MDHNRLRGFVNHIEQKKPWDTRIASACSFDIDFVAVLLSKFRCLIAGVFGQQEIQGRTHIESARVFLNQLGKVRRYMLISLVDAISRLVIQIKSLFSASERTSSSASGGMSFAKRR